MPDEKMFISLGVEDGPGVSSIVKIGISSVVYLGFPGLTDNSVPAHRITCDGTYVFPGIYSLGSAIFVTN